MPLPWSSENPCGNEDGVARAGNPRQTRGHAAQGKRAQVEDAQASGLSLATRDSCDGMQGDEIDEKNENENDIIDYQMIIEDGHMHDNYSGMIRPPWKLRHLQPYHLLLLTKHPNGGYAPKWGAEDYTTTRGEYATRDDTKQARPVT